MKIKLFFYTSLIASIGAYAYVQYRKRLSLIYEKNTGRLIINMKYGVKCCQMLTIEKIIISINGEEFKTLHFKHGEKVFEGPFIIDLPEAEVGDYIKVKLTSRCSRQFTNRGSLEIY